MNWTQFYPYFKPEEFVCNCGCGKLNIDPVLLKNLMIMRIEADFPFHITSGCRCEKFNLEIDGNKSGEHVAGQAADIYCFVSGKRFRIIELAYRLKIPRIGVGSNFVHIGISSYLPQNVLWVY